MPQRAWSDKRERQYDHIKESLEERGEKEDTAEEVAARTVNKERARAGEARESSRTSTEDISSGRRGGLLSHRGPGRLGDVAGPGFPGRGAVRLLDGLARPRPRAPTICPAVTPPG